MRIIGCAPEQFGAIWPQVEGFFTLVDGYLHLKRCNIELDRQDSKNRQRSEAGKRSAEKRTQQFQMRINDRSTVVQRPARHTVEDSRREDIVIDNPASLIPTAPLAPDGAKVSNGNGVNGSNHANGNGEDHGRGKRGSRISADWQLSADDTAYARKHGWSDADIARRAEEFRNYWLASSGKNAVKRDWSATWRNRVLAVEEYRSKPNGGRAGSNRQGSGLVAAMRNVMPGGARDAD